MGFYKNITFSGFDDVYILPPGEWCKKNYKDRLY